jgi:hypothetical protein
MQAEVKLRQRCTCRPLMGLARVRKPRMEDQRVALAGGSWAPGDCAALSPVGTCFSRPLVLLISGRFIPTSSDGITLGDSGALATPASDFFRMATISSFVETTLYHFSSDLL